jgi:hypothetical protein
MSHHKSEDYKLSAVKYYIKNKIGMEKVCQIIYVVLKKLPVVLHHLR